MRSISEPGEWVKIGEIEKTAGFFQSGVRSRYAVMEMICFNGMRKYKEVLMCSFKDIVQPIKSQ